MRNLRQGFTLIEMLAVIVIIGILAAGIFRLVGAGSDKAAIAETTAQIQAVASLLEEYRNLYGNYPRVTNVDEDGYAPLNFTFLARDGGSCSYCSASSNKSKQQPFGLCSHFIPRGTTMYSNCDDSMKDFYDQCFNDPAGKGGDGWEKEFGKRSVGNNLDDVVASEAADPNLQSIYRSWQRLKKDGLVYEEVGVCPYCDSSTYNAGIDQDAWEHSLKYRLYGGVGEIVSAGPDGKFGTGDDITSAGVAADGDDD